MAPRTTRSRFHTVRSALVFLVLGLPSLGVGAPEKTQPADPRIARLIDQLGDKEYLVRQEAQEELAKLGFAAYEPLTAAASRPDLEVATRAKYLLQLLWTRYASGQSSPRVSEILKNYNLLTPSARSRKLRELAALSDLEGVAALCRLACFEKSPELSATAAVALLNHEPPDAASQARFARLVHENLVGDRPGVKWLSAYLVLREDFEKGLPEWTRIVEAEQNVPEPLPNVSTPQTPSSGRAATVVPLLYVLARAYARHGDSKRAEEVAQQARDFRPSPDPARLELRLTAASVLRRHGRFAWAEAEFRQLIASNNSLAVFYGYYQWAEMLHDQENDEAAAKTCGKAIEALKQKGLDGIGEVEEMVKSPSEARARMSYFLACHYLANGNQAKYVECLEEAFRTDPTEVDTLIACYRLPNRTEVFRKRVLDAIQREADSIRREIAMDPENAEPYNQFAWLIGNTQGDLNEALRYAKKSLELRPNTSAFLDTLAHVYFTQGDLENAVKHQTQAAQLEPHSRLIARELQTFRTALAKKGER